MKKIFKLMLVMALVLTQVLSITMVSAATTGSITINTTTSQTKDGKVDYSIYKMFDLSYNETAKAYRYTISADSDWYLFVATVDGVTGAGAGYVTLTKSTENTYVVTMGELSADDMATFAKEALTYAKDNEIAATRTTSIAKGGTTVTVDGLDLGYYLVDSTLGSLCALTTTDYAATVYEKNAEPTLEKDVKEGNNWGDTSYAKIGDVVEYRSILTAQEGARNYKVYDTMSEGLTFNNDIVITLNGTTVATTNYSVSTTTSPYTFVIDFTDSFEDTLKDNDKLVITYTATLNEKAEISTDVNTNETHLTYGDENEFTSTPDSTDTYSFQFELVKYTGTDTFLDGAEFKLYDAAGNEIKVYLYDAATNTYRVAKTETELASATTIKAGKAIIQGLDGNTTYYLEEVVAPEGYNKLTDRVTVAIGTSNLGGSVLDGTKYTDFGTAIKVLNNTGSELPETGGMGTVLFVVIGSLLAIGTGVVLVTKFRLSKEV